MRFCPVVNHTAPDRDYPGLPATGAVYRAINRQLARRRQGYGRGGRMVIENDRVEFLSGCF